MDIHDINIRNAFIKIREAEAEAEPEFDSPHGSKWIVAVDDEGLVHVLSRPNIHDSFFECGSSAEELGLPIDTDVAPGIYEWICDINYQHDWESGYVDSWNFDVIEEKLLWTWDNGEADKAGNEKA